MNMTVNVVIPLITAVLSWWLTNLSRNRADRQAERVTLQVQADALTVAVAEVRGAAAVGRILWEGFAERSRTGFLATLAAGGGAARARAIGASDLLSFFAGLGSATHVLAGDRRASKQHAATVREPMLRLATAAAPLMRHPNTDLAEAAEELLALSSDIENDERADAALEAFGRAVRAALQEPPTRLPWRRRRSH